MTLSPEHTCHDECEKPACIEQRLRREGFAHPCKETCSGWKQGYDDGFDAGRKAALRSQLPTVAEIKKLLSDFYGDGHDEYTIYRKFGAQDLYDYIASRIEGEI
jgi:hypothetical protein